MAMAIDSRQHLTGLPYEHMRYQAPQFNNPWVAGTGAAAASNNMYAPAMPQATMAAQQQSRYSTAGTPVSYSGGTLPALALPQAYAQRPPVPEYSSPHPVTTAGIGYATPVTAAPSYSPADYAQHQQKLAAFPTFQDRRPSHPLNAVSDAERSSFSDALDASRGMVAMSQDITPRNIYGNANGNPSSTWGSSRSSTDSYGFPSTHSAHSSISGASGGYYYGSSVSEASYGDYSSASESVDANHRTLPRPTSMIAGGAPPAPSTMMGQFSSKVSSSSQKKHKCKICDKRFTRPSSLQTHMYSHTGEKPFACDVEGCGRHFSVVSNLRRHKKVHRGEASDHPSPDDD